MRIINREKYTHTDARRERIQNTWPTSFVTLGPGVFVMSFTWQQGVDILLFTLDAYGDQILSKL